MNKTRRLVRLHLLMLLLVLMPFGGFLWSVPHHEIYVALLAFICLVLAICVESIVQQTEREAMALMLKAKEDGETLAEWKEKVRELDRILAITTEENEEFRRAALDRKLHEVQA